MQKCYHGHHWVVHKEGFSRDQARAERSHGEPFLKFRFLFANRAWRGSSTGLIFSISFSHNHPYLTLVLQRSVSADIRIPDCSCEGVLVLDADRLISVPGPGQLSRFLNLSCESPNHVSYGNDQLSYLYPQRSVTVAKSQSYSAMSRTTGPSFSKHLKFVVVVKFCWARKNQTSIFSLKSISPPSNL